MCFWSIPGVILFLYVLIKGSYYNKAIELANVNIFGIFFNYLIKTISHSTPTAKSRTMLGCRSVRAVLFAL